MGSLYAPSDPLAAISLLIRGNGGMGEGLLVRETDGREGNSPKVKVRVE